MPYSLKTPLGRFGVETSEEGPDRCVASIPAGGFVNPLTGSPTIAALAMLVDHLGGSLNHSRRPPGFWTVSSELSLEARPDTVDILAGSNGRVVTGTARPVGAIAGKPLALCELRAAGETIATATVRSFYIPVPDTLMPWPDDVGGSLPGTRLDELMSVEAGEAGGSAEVLMQLPDPVLDNSVGIVHGGVSSMGLELVGSAALNADDDGKRFGTASLRVNFLRPFQSGGGARYVAKATHLGRSSGVAEAEAVGRDGRTALLARLTAYR